MRITTRTTIAVLCVAAALTACDASPDGTASEPTAATGEARPGGADASDEQTTAAGEDTVVDVDLLDGGECPGATASADHADVVGARFTPVAGQPGVWEVSATLCSLYDTTERYADAWRVVTQDGEELVVRELLHDHAGEQPFTRSASSPVVLPDGVTTVVVEARDQANGWGGATLEVALD